MRPPFGEPSRLREAAKQEAESVVGKLRLWHAKEHPGSGDKRAFNDRPVASILLDFYRSMMVRKSELEAADHLEAMELRELRELESVFKEETKPQGLLDLIAAAQGNNRTGDAITDDLIDRLDRGDVPDSFWGADEQGPTVDPNTLGSADPKPGKNKFAQSSDDVASWWEVDN